MDYNHKTFSVFVTTQLLPKNEGE